MEYSSFLEASSNYVEAPIAFEKSLKRAQAFAAQINKVCGCWASFALVVGDIEISKWRKFNGVTLIDCIVMGRVCIAFPEINHFIAAVCQKGKTEERQTSKTR